MLLTILTILLDVPVDAANVGTYVFGGSVVAGSSAVTIAIIRTQLKHLRAQQKSSIKKIEDVEGVVNNHLIEHKDNAVAETELKTDVRWIKEALVEIKSKL